MIELSTSGWNRNRPLNIRPIRTFLRKEAAMPDKKQKLDYGRGAKSPLPPEKKDKRKAKPPYKFEDAPNETPIETDDKSRPQISKP